MSRVLFLQNNGINESLALTEVSAMLQRGGHEVLLLLEDEERQLSKQVSSYNPQIAIVPCHVAGHEEALR